MEIQAHNAADRHVLQPHQSEQEERKTYEAALRLAVRALLGQYPLPDWLPPDPESVAGFFWCVAHDRRQELHDETNIDVAEADAGTAGS